MSQVGGSIPSRCNLLIDSHSSLTHHKISELPDIPVQVVFHRWFAI